MFYWGQPQFYGVRAAAANLGNSAGNYTAEQFQEDFPQFFTGLGESLLPRTMLDEFIRQANAAIQPDKWLDGWRYAAGLYTAHYATLYLKTDRKSTRLNSSHVKISYAVFCLKKKTPPKKIIDVNIRRNNQANIGSNNHTT